jgi:hypothetical protein
VTAKWKRRGKFAIAIRIQLRAIKCVADERSIPPWCPPIPPGWDFPEAIEAAAQGADLWKLDMFLKPTVDQRLRLLGPALRLKKCWKTLANTISLNWLRHCNRVTLAFGVGIESG